MESFDLDLGNELDSIDIGEDNSDMNAIGLDLLTNKNKQRHSDDNRSSSVGGGGGGSDTHTINVTLGGGSNMNGNNDGLNIEDPFGGNNSSAPKPTSIDDIFNSHVDKQPHSFTSPQPTTNSQPSFEDNITNIDITNELNMGGDGMNGPTFPSFDTPNMDNNSANINVEYQQSRPMTFEEIQKAKFDILCELERLRDKGVRIPKMFSMASDYDEMKYERDRLVHQRKLDNSVKMQRRFLITFVSGVEFLNNKVDPFDLKLDNWSEEVNENINDFDDVFEELYEKYKDAVDMAPELKLMFMLGGSAFMYHLNNTAFKSAVPGFGDIMKQNPELARQFTTAAMNSVSQKNPGLAGFMNQFGGGGGGMGQQHPQQVHSEVPPFNPLNEPPFSNPSGPPPREMPSPMTGDAQSPTFNTSQLDDVLNSINEQDTHKEINFS